MAPKNIKADVILILLKLCVYDQLTCPTSKDRRVPFDANDAFRRETEHVERLKLGVVSTVLNPPFSPCDAASELLLHTSIIMSNRRHTEPAPADDGEDDRNMSRYLIAELNEYPEVYSSVCLRKGKESETHAISVVFHPIHTTAPCVCA